MPRFVRIASLGSVALGFASLILVIVTIAMSSANRSRQAEVQGRQAFLAQTQEQARIAETMVRLMANVAVTRNEQPILDLLAANQISIAMTPPAAGAAR